MIHQITSRKQSIAEKIIMFLSRNLDVKMINKMAKKHKHIEIFDTVQFLSMRSLLSNLYYSTLDNGAIKINPQVNKVMDPISKGRWSPIFHAAMSTIND